MKESFEIPITCDLTEVREGDKVTYQGIDGSSVISVTTNDNVTFPEITCSKYRNAKVRVIIDIDHDDMAYKGVTP